MASVKLTNVNEKFAQIIVLGNVLSTNRVVNIESFSSLQKQIRSKYYASDLCNSKEDLEHWVGKLLKRIAPAV